MPLAIRERLEIFRDIAERPWFRAVCIVWWAVGAWDLFLSQFVPEEYSRNFPKLYQAIGLSAGWLPLGAWLMVGAILLVAGAIEGDDLRRGGSSRFRNCLLARLPIPWKQFVDPLRWMIGQLRENVGEPGLWIDVV